MKRTIQTGSSLLGKIKHRTLFNIFILASWVMTVGCLHNESNKEVPSYSSVHDDRVTFRPWLEYMSDLEGMGSETRGSELGPLQKSFREWCSDEDLRYALTLSFHYYHNRNYSKAAEILSQLANKKNLNSNLRNWLRVSIAQLNDISDLEKEIAAEKKQRVELERKLRALSEIEREISERDMKGSPP